MVASGRTASKGRGNGATPVRPTAGDATPVDSGQPSDTTYGGLEVSAERTRLRIPRDLSLEAWCRLGGRILAVCDSSVWWIGDWLVFGQNQYGDRYRRAMKETKLDYQTLRNYAWVARKFEPSRRRDSLTFQHHMEVAALSEAEQDHWLDFAVRLNWSRNELRKQIRASLSGEEDDLRCEVQLNLQLDELRLERWREAARGSNLTLTDWILSVVDGAV
ncbi:MULTISPECIES: novobiocin biosynthesis transcriptional regulator NovE [Streptomyces]|uniref:Transcriptional regulator NovE n=1 Tax=Streptomyces niveus TaxID=193462 RepID=NOVE_STRNV|nr:MULTISPECIES: novobiocin biosynthesis transcriptional regulator NovE [Streptomyces]Q9L9G3.1 RecName: Full=Transcriptional regulator NovE; AltName: Full=Novobiocin biosynthesis protein E [Streptomyces niveus]AAF67498.1 NovE [Streptomyces niveus]